MNGWSVVLGLMGGWGVISVVAWFRARKSIWLNRVCLRLRLHSGDSGVTSRAPGNQEVPSGILSMLFLSSARMMDRWGSPTTGVSSRLSRAGSSLAVSQFRAEQVVWGVAGTVLGLMLAGLQVAKGGSLLPLGVMVVCCGLSGVALREYVLSRAIRKREAHIVSELPTVADVFAIAVSAGEGASAAIERIAAAGSGALAGEFRVVVGEVRTGTSLVKSLRSLAERTGVAALSRFASGIAIAIERGTPLADVLHAQALDVREAGRRSLIEEGGKREIAMMIPVVFLLLPVTVVFAVFPGIVAIRFGP